MPAVLLSPTYKGEPHDRKRCVICGKIFELYPSEKLIPRALREYLK
nr:MAG TPA: hypothetical protein [Caudoviricetes sp.]